MSGLTSITAEILERGIRLIRVRTEEGEVFELALAMIDIKPTDDPNLFIIEGPACAFHDCEV